MKRAVIFANGRLLPSYTEGIRKTDLVIGVDQAAYWLIRHGVVPDAAVGDFDSVTAAEMAGIREKTRILVEYSAEKDETDLDLAVGYALGRKMSHIIIYGAYGSRLDHTVSNVNLLEQYASKDVSIVLRDDRNEVFLLTDSVIVRSDPAYRYLSVLPATRTAIVSLSGVKYPVAKRIFLRGSTLGVSNEIIASEARILVHRGKALVIRSRD